MLQELLMGAVSFVISLLVGRFLIAKLLHTKDAGKRKKNALLFVACIIVAATAVFLSQYSDYKLGFGFGVGWLVGAMVGTFIAPLTHDTKNNSPH